MANKIKRTMVLINRKFQLHFIGLLMGGLLVAMLLFTLGFLVIAYVQDNLGENKFEEYLIVKERVQKVVITETEAGPQEQEVFVTRDRVMKPFEYMLPYVLWNNAIILLIISILALNLSHRLAGPIYRINKTIEAAVQGPLERPIKLRKKDFFQETAHKLNTLFKKTEIL
jgi:nitrogen fixation/metabolism regulation signal transduction histidine kinase